MKKIIYTKNGALCVFHAAIQAKLDGESEEQCLARLMPTVVPAGAVNARIVEFSEIPTDRSFRDAWTDTGSSVTVDMPKAREIHREKLRRLRKPKLEALDVEALRNITNSAKLAEIEARKQELRDATAFPAIDTAATPDALKLAVPSCLA